MHIWTIEGVEAEIKRLIEKKPTNYAALIADFVTCANLVDYNIVSIEYDSQRDVLVINKDIEITLELVDNQRRTWPRFFEELRRQRA